MGRWQGFAAIIVAMLAGLGPASAQSNFPTKPVHIFVPYAAGGGVDILARTLGDVVSRQWGQTVVVENRPGAGGVVASQALVQTPPDGYTLIVLQAATQPIRSSTQKSPTTRSATSRRSRCSRRRRTSFWCAPILRSRV
jgi:tripartite-type tricarboxylate transporter receptor subunit TctC